MSGNGGKEELKPSDTQSSGSSWTDETPIEDFLKQIQKLDHTQIESIKSKLIAQGAKTVEDVKMLSEKNLTDSGVPLIPAKRILSALGSSLAPGSGSTSVTVDATAHVLATLLAGFTSLEIPKTFDLDSLKQLLQQPLATTILSKESISLPSPFHTLLQQSSTAQTLPLLFWIGNIAHIPLPDENSAEIVWSGYWDNILPTLVRYAQQHNLLKGVEVNRNVEDSSITTEDLKRDFLLWFNNILLVAGEDKRWERDLKDAILELKTKHRGCNESLYGSLKYIFAFATAGPSIQFFALPLPRKSDPQAISKVYNITKPTDRMSAVVCFVNILRWIVGVCSLQDLFPTFVLPHQIQLPRRSPWFENEDMSASIEAHSDYVIKRIKIPESRIVTLVFLYRKLKSEHVPHTVTPLKVLLNDRDLLMEQIPSKKSDSFLELHLQPVGASRRPANSEELKIAIKSVFQFLESFHKSGYVHRDIRWPNIICCRAEWIVIDLELAAELAKKEPVFWNNACLPPDVAAKTAIYTVKSDLYEVGTLLRDIALASTIPDAVDLRDKLLQFQFENATNALKHQWFQNDSQ